MITTRSVTRIVEEESRPLGFSCSPMTVTDDSGDQLTLDEQCNLYISSGEESGTSVIMLGEDSIKLSAVALGSMFAFLLSL